MPILSPSTSPRLRENRSFHIAEDINIGRAIVHFASKQIIGRGGQGVVYSVRVDFLEPISEQTIETRQCVLKKIVYPLDDDQSDSFGVHSEITKEDASTIDHNILKLICILKHENQNYALFPLCETFLNKQICALHAVGAKAMEPLLKLAFIVHVITNLLNALSYLHSKGFVHRDIKPENIAFHRGRWCIIDLDLATTVKTESVLRGTAYFVHPAAVITPEYLTDPLNDIYALGVVLKIMLDRDYWSELRKTRPIAYLYHSGLAYARMKKEPPIQLRPLAEGVDLVPISSSIENDLKELASRMTSLDEQAIPNVTVLLSIFNELNNCLFAIDSNINSRLNDYYSQMIKPPAYIESMSSRFFPTLEKVLHTSQCNAVKEAATFYFSR